MPASARAFLVQDFSGGEISYKAKKAVNTKFHGLTAPCADNVISHNLIFQYNWQELHVYGIKF